MDEAKPDIRTVLESEGITLKRGRALCPFHPDKHPSLTVKNERFKCWSCGASGDAIDLVMRLHGLDFLSALRYLGLERSGLSRTEMEDIATQKKERLRRKEAVRRFREWCDAYHNELCRKIKEAWRLRHEVTSWADAVVQADVFKNESVWTYRADILESGNDELRFQLFRDLSGGRA